MRVPVLLLPMVGATAALVTPRQTRTEPCATVTYQQARGARYVNVSTALACLRSVELDVVRDVSLLDFAVPFLNFQSNLAFMKDPPPELRAAVDFDGVDILGGLADIRKKVLAREYANQFEFTTAVERLIASGRDSHFVLKPALNAVFVFVRNVSLVSVSSDGISPPQIYEENDFIASHAAGREPSAVVTVDGTPVQEVLAELSRVARAMDLDAGFNMLFPSQGKTAAGWTTDLFYAGSYLSLDADQTVLGLADGSTLSFINAAVPQIDFTGIRSGADLHRAVEVLGPIVRRSSTSGGAVNTTPASPFVQQPPDSIRSTAAASKMVEERQAFCRPVVDPDAMALRRTWPAPVDSHYDGYAAGYFLDSPGYSNVAVLQLGSFGNPRATSEICDIKEFHRFIGSFVVRALDANKTRLIVDVRSNPGGAEGILGDAFDHLFPGVVPDFRWRTRATPAVDWLGNASYIPGTDTADRVVIFTGLRNPDSTPTANASFPTWRDFFGPRTIRNDNFTRLSARNMRTERARFEIDFLPANLTRQLVTSPGQDLVVLTDGDCHSSCALLVGWLTRQLGARVVMVGGRPTTGKPVAAVGGTKGASVYDWDAFVVSVSIAAGELGITRVSGLPQNVPLPPLTAPPINVVVRQLNTMDVWITADDDDKAAAAVPVHFLHEPADCRLFNTPATLASPEAMWKAVADVAWAGKRCTPGSTGTPNDVMRGTVPQVSPGSAAVTVRDARAADRVTENFRLLLDSLPARLRTRETVALRRAASERREWGAATVVLEP